jgi:hypothetical protein
MTGHRATVLPFKDAVLRPPIEFARVARAVSPDAASLGPPPDNVVVLASFARSARRALRQFHLDSPPEGEAA